MGGTKLSQGWAQIRARGARGELEVIGVFEVYSVRVHVPWRIALCRPNRLDLAERASTPMNNFVIQLRHGLGEMVAVIATNS